MTSYRNLLLLPLQDDQLLTVASDNSGNIGEKRDDAVNVPYDIVAYYGTRVCLMETLATASKPKTLIIHSFNDEKAWSSLVQGATRAFEELGLDKIEITGSTESNFSLVQSATGFTLIGSIKKQKLRTIMAPYDARYAVVGKPLVGDEIIKHPDEILPLKLFKKLCDLEEIYELIPVGSKGIKKELDQICKQGGEYKSALPLDKSAGPSSCILISYDIKNEKRIKDLTGDLFYPLFLNKK
ncbi:hypothetical protein AWM68_14520 [Fictibacillus phosphorivorans]|uniref:ATP-binding protein n=1 Tax=Fictibacillus phosphorivorans TaxID=1221500 RepID=A0A161RSI7_9BACL|nr:hypothetical protein [Fictibacillus phosphorivorans]KZE64299.1 hypothetical protein AWM68_14520 [Fictibacillus phosphorivorans]